jgi:hypothetical protein
MSACSLLANGPVKATVRTPPWISSRLERGQERRAGLERLLLDRLEAGVRTGACSDPSRSRGIDSTASPAEAAVVDQCRDVGWVGERLAASEQRDGQEQEPRPVRVAFCLWTSCGTTRRTGRAVAFVPIGSRGSLLQSPRSTRGRPRCRTIPFVLRRPCGGRARWRHRRRRVRRSNL